MLLGLGLIAAAAQAQAPAAAPGAPAAPAAAAPAGAAPDAQQLKALFIEVNGKVQWRAGADQPWQNAKVNDVVTPGGEVRTGLKSFAALRVGDNATALIDAGTMFQMPSVVKDGDTLRTTVSVKSGRADFKVDKVGLTNDFKVVTPSTTLAVRGTEFAVASGALKNVEVLGARRNTINAIELKYALNNTVVRMSGAAASNSNLKQPTHNAVVATASPATAGALPSTNSTETVANAAVGPSPANAGSPAEAQQSNNAAAKTQTAVSREQTADDGNSLAARIARAIREAQTRLDRAIAYNLAMDGELGKIDDQKLLVDGLADLAEAKRAEARLMLGQNEVALVGANGTGGMQAKRREALGNPLPDSQGVKDVGGRDDTFRTLIDGVNEELRLYEAVRAQAGDSLQGVKDFSAAVASAGTGRPSDPDESAWSKGPDGEALAFSNGLDDLLVALSGMNSHFSEARAKMVAADKEIKAVGLLLTQALASEVPSARDAGTRFRAAVAALEIAATTNTGDAVRIATLARNAAADLKALIDGADVLGLAPTDELLLEAEKAAGKLALAGTRLNEVESAARSVRGIRDAYALERSADARVALLGRVEQIYDEMQALHTGMIFTWAKLDAPASGSDPEGRFRAAESGMESLLGSRGESSEVRTVGSVEAELGVVADLALAGAVAAESRATAARARSVGATDPETGRPIGPGKDADPRTLDAAYNAALAAVDRALEDVEDDGITDRLSSGTSVTFREETRDAIVPKVVELSDEIAGHDLRFAGASPGSVLEPLYRPLPVLRTLTFETNDGAPSGSLPSSDGTGAFLGASALQGAASATSYGGFEWGGEAWVFRRDPTADNGFTLGVPQSSGQGQPPNHQAAFNNRSAEFYLARSEAWTFESAQFTSAWLSDLSITVVYTKGGVERPVELSDLHPIQLGDPRGGPVTVSLRALGLTDITSVRLSAAGSVSAGFPDGDTAAIFVMDNLAWRGVPSSRAEWTPAYAPAVRAGQLTAIADTVKSLDQGVFVAITSLSEKADQLRELDWSAKWQADVDGVLNRGRSALQAALELGMHASDREHEIAKDDAESQRILAVSSEIHDVANQLQVLFSLEYGTFADGLAQHGLTDGAAAGVASKLASIRQLRVDADALVERLRSEADRLSEVSAITFGPALEQWAVAVRDAMTRNVVATGELADAEGAIGRGLATYKLRATEATDVFAKYAASAADAAADAARRAGEAQEVIAGVDAPVAALGDLRQAGIDAGRSLERRALFVNGSDARLVGGMPIAQAISEVRSDVGGLASQDGQSLGARTPVSAILADLEAVHQALFIGLKQAGIDIGALDIGQAASDATVSGVDARLTKLLGRQASGSQEAVPSLTQVAATVANRVRDLRTEIRSGSSSRVDDAVLAASAAGDAEEGATRLAAVAAELKARYGAARIDDSAIQGSAAAARASAAAAAAAADAASDADESMVATLNAVDADAQARGGDWADWASAISTAAHNSLSTVRAALVNGQGVETADAAAFRVQLRAYSDAHLEAAEAVAGLVDFDERSNGSSGGGRTPIGAADAIAGQLRGINGGQTWSAGEVGTLRDLREQVAPLTRAVAAMDGADGAARRADTAAREAVVLRGVAEAREQDARLGLERTQGAFVVLGARIASIPSMSALEAAVQADLEPHRRDTVTASVLSRAAADLAGVRASQAERETAIARDFQADADFSQLRRDWAVSGAQEAFVESVDGKKSAMLTADRLVNGTRPSDPAGASLAPFDPDFTGAGSLRDQVAFFDDIVQVLSGRVDTSDPASAARASSAANWSRSARELATAAARQLASQADSARTLAQTAGSNAARFHASRMVDYYIDAHASYMKAVDAAGAAAVAAENAEGHAVAAGEVVTEARKLVPGG